MEFNTLMNELLSRDVDSRRRNLKIKTYAVIPLNEETGLIEWVPGLSGTLFVGCLLLYHILLLVSICINTITSHTIPLLVLGSRNITILKTSAK